MCFVDEKQKAFGFLFLGRTAIYEFHARILRETTWPNEAFTQHPIEVEQQKKNQMHLVGVNLIQNEFYFQAQQ